VAITRASIETILIRRAGKVMTAVGLDGVTCDGTNVDLNDPAGYALRQLGYTVADLVNVSNADLASVSADEIDQLLDIAELRTLENALQNCDQVTISVGPRTENLSDLRDGLEKAITRKRDYLTGQYGSGATLEAGAIGLSFQQHDDPLSTQVLP
jgi:hypothetical protein